LVLGVTIFMMSLGCVQDANCISWMRCWPPWSCKTPCQPQSFSLPLLLTVLSPLRSTHPLGANGYLRREVAPTTRTTLWLDQLVIEPCYAIVECRNWTLTSLRALVEAQMQKMISCCKLHQYSHQPISEGMWIHLYKMI
jgi:hypothetical protein